MRSASRSRRCSTTCADRRGPEGPAPLRPCSAPPLNNEKHYHQVLAVDTATALVAGLSDHLIALALHPEAGLPLRLAAGALVIEYRAGGNGARRHADDAPLCPLA